MTDKPNINNIISFPNTDFAEPSTQDYINLLVLFRRIKSKKRRGLLLKTALNFYHLDATDRGLDISGAALEDPKILEKLIRDISSTLKSTIE